MEARPTIEISVSSENEAAERVSAGLRGTKKRVNLLVYVIIKGGVNVIVATVKQLLQYQEPTVALELYLNGNRLQYVPDIVSELTSLEALWLHDNQLSSLPLVMCRLVNLKLLSLSSNEFRSLPTFVGQFPHLKKLHVAGRLDKKLMSQLN